MKKIINNEKGFILPLVLVVIALLAGGVGYLLTQGMVELKANVLNQDYELCILTGKNAMAVARSELENDINYSGTNGIQADENGGNYSIVITVVSENCRFIDVKSNYRDFHKKFNGEIEIIPKNDEISKGLVSTFKWKMLEAE
ncbi:hypothetical protein [Acetobacterium tundrae]|uniref:Uncharacterized protein n=1 Tax=Acetobacterium tundrae TaxID=132932 RepID=A0ABR6WNG8_9FIRM|nr:hypothetical protein [Acetobacterium tundrae]MBC3797841.1 hypothetical protein [Acetobacterium tundrae]